MRRELKLNRKILDHVGEDFFVLPFLFENALGLKSLQNYNFLTLRKTLIKGEDEKLKS